MVERLEAEDLARARWYSFFSRWFLAPPDQQAIDLFVATDSHSPPGADLAPDGAGVPDCDLAAAWTAFTQAVARQPLDSLRSAYDDTFITVGEAPVSLHASVYLTGFSNERPLAEVRQWLAGKGIQSGQAGLLTEDHLGLLCEAMAWLIIGAGDEEPSAASVAASDESQQFLYQRFIAPMVDDFCRRLADAPDAGAYRELGQLFSAFCAVERQAFDIDR